MKSRKRHGVSMRYLFYPWQRGWRFTFFKVNRVKALYWSTIINGVLAPFLLTAIVFVASDARLMKKQPSSMVARICVGLTTLLMYAAAAGMFLF